VLHARYRRAVSNRAWFPSAREATSCDGCTTPHLRVACQQQRARRLTPLRRAFARGRSQFGPRTPVAS